MNSQNANATQTITQATEITDDQIETIIRGEWFGSWTNAEDVWSKTEKLLPSTVTKERALPICAKVAKAHNDSLER